MALSNNPLLIPPVIPTPAPSGARMPTASLNNTQAANIGSPAAPQCNIFWVKDLDAVLNHPTSPNEHLYFGSEEDPIIYVRETDANGQVKSPIKVLHYTIEEVPIGPEAQFVTKDEHKQLFDLVEKLSVSVGAMDQKLEKLLNG